MRGIRGAAVASLLALIGAAMPGAPDRVAAQPPGANLRQGCAAAFDPAADYFPSKARIEDAANFEVAYHRFYKAVIVRAGAGAAPERYVLLQCGAPAPRLRDAFAGAQIISVPITTLFAASTTHLSLLVDLERLDVLTGVSRLRELSGPALMARAASGLVREFAPVSTIDPELVVAHRPSLFMAGGGTASASLPPIRAAGIPVVANTEWLEPTALGRAEWLKYLALFLNEEARAAAVYDAMKARYQALKARAQAVPEPRRPLVMTGRSTRGAFTIAGGRSYVASLIHDAGGRYVWADDTSVGAPLVDLEAQIGRAAGANVWINGGGWPSRPAMLDNEPRYAAFKAYRDRQVWVYDQRLAANGLSDYFLRSVTRPDLVLADLIKIFHPALMTDHAFEWYARVPDRHQ